MPRRLVYGLIPLVMAAMTLDVEAGRRARRCCCRAPYQAHLQAACGTCETACQTEACAPAACAPQASAPPQQVVRYVPQTTTERRSCEVIVYRPEQRERQITIHEQVAEQRDVEYTVTVMERQNRSRTEYFTVRRPVQREVEQHYTVNVPYTEQRQATRLVSRLVPVQLTRTICEDQGRWEERPCETQQQTVAYRGNHAAEGDACGACGAQPCADACATSDACAPACAATTRVWVPNIVRREVPYTQMQVKCEQQPYEFTVNLCRQEQRTRNVTVTEYVQERQSREVPFTVLVPRQETRTRQVTEYRTVPKQISQPCTVMVAHREVREYEVPVTRMVAQICEVPSPAACPTNACE